MIIMAYHPYENILFEEVKEQKLWWDHLYQKMLIFHCSKIEFNYELQKYIKTDKGNKSFEEASEDEINTYGITESYEMRPVPKTYKKTISYKKRKNCDRCKLLFDEYVRYNDENDIDIINNNDLGLSISIKNEKIVEDFLYFFERQGIRVETIED